MRPSTMQLITPFNLQKLIKSSYILYKPTKWCTIIRYSTTYSPHLSTKPHIKSELDYAKIHAQALQNPSQFWLDKASLYYWQACPTLDNVFRYNFDPNQGTVFVKWFEDGLTNMCYNALDRHVEAGHEDKVAFYWEGNHDTDKRTIAYGDLLREVKRTAHLLKKLGVSKGDCVAIYMPMVPEVVMTMLACTRIGAIHSVVFGGFSSVSLADRIMDAKCNVLITCDGGWRGTKRVELKSIASAAMDSCEKKGHKVKHCVVLRHVSSRQDDSMGNNKAAYEPARTVDMKEGRDIWWHDAFKSIPKSVECPVEWMNAEDTLFILYTSGSTGRPKGIVHTTGGYMVYVGQTFYYTFDYHKDDVYWCTADVGWITGHSYSVYGPLLNGCTSVLFEGIPTWPDPGRYWSIVQKYKVSKFYTAPTAIRTLIQAGDQYVKPYDRSSLKILGTVGEPINSSAWKWYFHVVGSGNCPIVDTFWQTETGGHMITPLPAIRNLKPGCAMNPFPGIDARIFSEDAQDLTRSATTCQSTVEGYLVFSHPWPGMMRTIFGNHQLFESLYFKRFPGHYVAGDGAKMDADGHFWITGRLDDMINVSGHLLSTADVENALLNCPDVSEAAVVGRHHLTKGECLHCFLSLKDTCQRVKEGKLDSELVAELQELVRGTIGSFAVPDVMQDAPVLPKTRSGKIIRRLLRQIANGDYEFGDISTLVDPSCLKDLVERSKCAS